MIQLALNERALRRCEELVEAADTFRVIASQRDCGSRIIDCGVDADGGFAAGKLMAEICLADLGTVQLETGRSDLWPGPSVTVATDHPLAACMASQYAGWQINLAGYFAMGSGPMRAARGREELFQQIGLRESTLRVVGVLEAGQLPSDEVCRQLAEECQVDPRELTLLVAPTASLCGTLQVVARTVETALHKMHELGFDLRQVAHGFGSAPLPPPAADDLAAIGRTNDAVLYGGEVTLWIKAADEQLEELGPQIPSSASSDHGRPFREIFERYERDFYKIDPHLFSPASIHLLNFSTGRCFHFGQFAPEVLAESFSGTSSG